MAGSEIQKNTVNPRTSAVPYVSEPMEPDQMAEESGDVGVRKISSKLELWENKLLDLTTRNMLLSLPRIAASVLPVMSSHIEELENSLADGREFQLKPAPEWITDIYIEKNPGEKGREYSAGDYLKIKNYAKDTRVIAGKKNPEPKNPEPKNPEKKGPEKEGLEASQGKALDCADLVAEEAADPEKEGMEADVHAARECPFEKEYVNWLEDTLRNTTRFEIVKWPRGEGFDVAEDIRGEYKKHRLYSFNDKKELDRELTAIFRAARASQQENGVSSLYLAIGILKWYAPTPSGGVRTVPCYAPLILLPIEIIRKSVFRGYALHARDEEPHFNMTLLELLRRNYNTEIPGVDPMPGDEHGIDIKKTFEIVRESLSAFKNWEVLETCVIGNFSFAQFSMWKDIHTGIGMLTGSKVVRSLMKGHVDWVDPPLTEGEESTFAGQSPGGFAGQSPDGLEGQSPDGLEGQSPGGQAGQSPGGFAGQSPKAAAASARREEPYLPISVDSTQLRAIEMAASGKTFVLHGPPGTGKSQTITGMIANLLAEGKTVLFVAEKMAALTVVQRRLESLGISDFCLELHSDKANKKHILAQLDKALESYVPRSESRFSELRRQTEEAGARLDGYARSLHTPRRCGYSLRQMIDYYETVRHTKESIRFRTEEAAAITKEKLESHLSLIGQLTAAGEALKNRKESPLEDVGLQSYTADVRLVLRENLEDYEASLIRLRDAYDEALTVFRDCVPGSGDRPFSRDCVAGSGDRPFSRDYVAGSGDRPFSRGCVPGSGDRPFSIYDLDELLTVFFREKNPDPVLGLILTADQGALQEYYKNASRMVEERRRLLTIWHPELLEKQLDDYLIRHERAGKKFFGRAKAMEYVTDELRAYTDVDLTYGEIPAMLQVVADYQRNLAGLQEAFRLLTRDQRAILEKYPTLDQYVNAVQEAVCFKKDIDMFPGGLDAIRRLSEVPGAERVFVEYSDAFRVFSEKEKAFGNLLQRKSRTGERIGEQTFESAAGGAGEQSDGKAGAGAGKRIGERVRGRAVEGYAAGAGEQINKRAGKTGQTADSYEWIQSELDYCEYVRSHMAELKNRGLYNKVREDCVRAGIAPVVREYEKGMPAEKIPGAYRKGLYYALINDAAGSDDVLSCFSGATFNEAVEQFGYMDDALMEQTEREIRMLLASRVPGENEGSLIGRELNILRKAIKSGGRGISIRELFGRIPHILPRLCPCILMSPSSAAQYLEQKNDLFDVAIFDEASQIPTCKAVGAIARAKNAVIVGDPKQMPPTAFFAAAGPDVDDVALYDLDSILDDALALGIHSHYLQWHYRSTHESLIAFSNREFYDNKIFSFPSADDREYHVTTVHVDGLYGDGVNEKEAQAVVDEILRRYNDPALRGQSIGVVTFNIKQQALIENLLSAQYLENSALDEWANDGEDPLFVKNLENVQGDERDAILFSVGYGPDENGVVSNNFGPINQAGGEKRLNVAFSRARVTMKIFTSLRFTDIRVTQSSSAGVAAFRDFLRYADMEKSQDGASSQEQSGADSACGVSAQEQSEADSAGGASSQEQSGADSACGVSRHDRAGEGSACGASTQNPTGADFAYDGSGILQSICREISNAGYRCETMIGRSDFHIDIAVYDPYDPGRYMLGILLDGETYRRAGNTRDRELSQINVLRTLGWTLLRVWTMDWWDNRDGEIRRLLETIERLKSRSAERAALKKDGGDE